MFDGPFQSFPSGSENNVGIRDSCQSVNLKNRKGNKANGLTTAEICGFSLQSGSFFELTSQPKYLE